MTQADLLAALAPPGEVNAGQTELCAVGQHGRLLPAPGRINEASTAVQVEERCEACRIVVAVVSWTREAWEAKSSVMSRGGSDHP